MRIPVLSRYLALMFSSITMFVIAPFALYGQVASPVAPTAADGGRGDAYAYALLFRRAVTYRQMAEAAKSPEQPEAHLRTVLPEWLSLSVANAASLEEVSKAWAKEILPLRANIRLAIDEHHKIVSSHTVSDTAASSSVVALASLRQQIDSVTLRYRDIWENKVEPLTFLQIQAQVRRSFGKRDSLKSNSANLGGGAR